jgi:uncharacterized RDD family membrane protein YckC
MDSRRYGTLTIRTPEGVAFAIPLAGLVTRMLAYTIDLACISVVTGIVGHLLSGIAALSGDAVRAITALTYFVIGIGYAIALEWFWRGQTIGKRVLHIRVMDRGALRLRPSQIILRNLIRAIDMLPALYAVGGVTCLLTRHAQRLGDLAANTVVVRTATVQIPDLSQIRASKFNSLREHAHLAARLRRRVTPELAAVALEAILRRDSLEPAARLKIFEDLANAMKSLVEFPAEATETLADEHYVRNVLEIFFAR